MTLQTELNAIMHTVPSNVANIQIDTFEYANLL